MFKIKVINQFSPQTAETQSKFLKSNKVYRKLHLQPRISFSIIIILNKLISCQKKVKNVISDAFTCVFLMTNIKELFADHILKF